MKKISPLCVLALVLVLPSFSFAGGWSEPSPIISIGTNVGRILVLVELNPDNPDYCDNPTPLILSPDRPDYPELYALLVASFLQEKQVEVFVHECIEMYDFSYPSITAVTSHY